MKKIGLVAALLSLYLLVAGASDTTHATTITPTFTVSLSNASAGANSNINYDYVVDSPDALEAIHVSFIPSEFGVADDASVPTGAGVGGIAVTTVESHSNGSCSVSPFLSYDLYDATTNTLNVLADDPRLPAATWPGFADADLNGLADAIDKYPNFLNTLYPGITPRARAFGSVDSAIGFVDRAVNVLTFEPGTTLPGLGALDPALGYPVVVIVQDPTAPALPGLVTDQCTLFRHLREDRGLTRDNINTAANEAGFVNRTNPAIDATPTFLEYAQTVRDQDGDGIENTLDSCPYDSTPTWNPRGSDPVNDFDADGIPNICDPTPTTANSDEDGDLFLNRQDNCPIVANGAGQDNQADSDSDGIGDMCDVVVTAPDGHLHEVCVTQDVVVGAGGTPTAPTCPEVVLDEDGDGFDRLTEEHIGTDPEDPCGTSAWPADIVSVGPPDTLNKVNIVDLQSYILPVRRLNTSLGDPDFDVRWDIVPGPGFFGEDINIEDLQKMVFVMPPILEGPRAFNGPTCPYP